MNIGAKVRLVGKKDLRTYTIAKCEEHFGTLFYRLCEFPHSLFLPSSLEEVRGA
jgi:hypothetical protein